jgi:hypothetical protein
MKYMNEMAVSENMSVNNLSITNANFQAIKNNLLYSTEIINDFVDISKHLKYVDVEGL